MILSETLKGGQIQSAERDHLSKYRKDRKVSDVEHFLALKHFGWSEEEFAMGCKLAPNEQIVDQYRKMLDEALKPGRVTEKTKQKLREHRKAFSIPHELHTQCLKRAGWTPDEYEAGFTSSEQYVTSDFSFYPFSVFLMKK